MLSVVQKFATWAFHDHEAHFLQTTTALNDNLFTATSHVSQTTDSQNMADMDTYDGSEQRGYEGIHYRLSDSKPPGRMGYYGHSETEHATSSSQFV